MQYNFADIAYSHTYIFSVSVDRPYIKIERYAQSMVCGFVTHVYIVESLYFIFRIYKIIKIPKLSIMFHDLLESVIF